ncbi:hypothetical protein P9869_17080 [Streptomyces ossamyceticus]|nr:hypothetical protein [Streptomyces ossamyceticus]
MHPRRPHRTALPVVAAVLCGLLVSCSSGSASPTGSASPAASPSPSTAGQVVAIPPDPTGSPSVKTLPPSRLCAVLDRSAARQALTDPRQTPRVAPEEGTAPDSCSHTSGDGSAMLTLSLSTRSYAGERSAAHSLVLDPEPAGMRAVEVTTVDRLGQAAFRKTAQVVEPAQNVTFVVWRSGSRTWVLTLAEARGRTTPGADSLVGLARRIAPRLPG